MIAETAVVQVNLVKDPLPDYADIENVHQIGARPDSKHLSAAFLTPQPERQLSREAIVG
jgi:hypothetical protein